jgi:hypothetical protein
VETVVDPDRRFLALAAGCLYEGHRGNQWPNACHVLEVVLDELGQPRRFEVRFRSWSPNGHWFDDNKLYRDTRDGRLTWSVEPAPTAAPPARTGSFIGREAELDTIAAALLSTQRLPVAVHGMPGVGKTHLVQQFANLNGEKYPGGVVQSRLDPQMDYTTERLLEDIVERLSLPAEMARKPAEVRERLLQPLTLLILENIDSSKLATPVATLLRQLGGCPTLVTGRLQGLGVSAGWKQVALGIFNESSSLALLGEEVGPPRDATDTEARRQLTRGLGHLPLALHLAAGYLRVGSHTPATFLDLLRANGFELPHVDPADPGAAEDRARAVLSTTFELSLDLLHRQLGPDGGELVAAFAALGHLAPDGFGPEFGRRSGGPLEHGHPQVVAPCTRPLPPVRRPAPRAPGPGLAHPPSARGIFAGEAGSSRGLGSPDGMVLRGPRSARASRPGRAVEPSPSGISQSARLADTPPGSRPPESGHSGVRIRPPSRPFPGVGESLRARRLGFRR